MRNLHENTRSNTRAAKRKSILSASQNSPETHESPEISATTEEINEIFLKVYNQTHTMYTEQTGKSPVRSSRGQKYMVVANHVDRN